MGRPRKTPIETKKKSYSNTKSNSEVLISEKDVYDVLTFASNLYGGNGVFTPNLINARLQDVGMTPLVATADDIDKALSDPKNSEQKLIGYSQWLELNNMLFKRSLHYFSGMLSFDLTYAPIGIKPSDLKSPKYKKDVKIVEDFLNKFNIKKQFGLIMRQMIRNEAFFGILRDDGDVYDIQELPQDYCLITGRSSAGLLFDINLYLFYQPGQNIDMYPKVFKKMYNDVFNPESSKLYNPATAVGDRNSQWVLYHQTSPADGFVCIKFSPEVISRVPFLSSMMPEVVIQPIIRKLQTNSYIAQASKLILGRVPLLANSVKGSSVKDSLAVSPDVLGKFLALIKAGLPDVVKIGASPLEQMTPISFQGEDFYANYLKTSVATSGASSRLFFQMDRGNAIETQLAVDTDFFLMEQVYPYFEEFLNYHINKRCENFRFDFKLEGSNFFTTRKARLDTQIQLMGLGIVNVQKLSAALGQLPHIFETQLAMAKESGFVDGLTPIVMAAQMSNNGEGSSNGRPSKSISDLGDAGVSTRDQASNVEKE